MVNLDIAKEYIEEALYNLANLDLFIQDAKTGFGELSEERQKDLLFLIDGKTESKDAVITKLEKLGQDLSEYTAYMLNEASVIMQSIYKNHITEEEEEHFKFVEKSQEIFSDALESMFFLKIQFLTKLFFLLKKFIKKFFFIIFSLLIF